MFKELIRRGSPESAMRWLIIFSYVFVIGVVITAWAVLSFVNSALQDIPSGLLALVSAVITIVTAGKWLEKREETKENIKAKEAEEGCGEK